MKNEGVLQESLLPSRTKPRNLPFDDFNGVSTWMNRGEIGDAINELNLEA